MRHLTTMALVDVVARTGSIRKAAEEMAITPSALHRRVQAFEEELGEQIFERLPHGVRLNAAGEMVILHIRNQIAETDRLKSRLADLSGMRRGHVSIACSQALTPYFLPKEIAKYRKAFPEVTFDVRVLDHLAAEQALIDYSVDLALVFDSAQMAEFEVSVAARQELRAIMVADHPLAKKEVLRLRDCLKFPLALPTTNLGGRQLLQKSVALTSLHLSPSIESNSFEFLKKYILEEKALTFQIPIGAPDEIADDERLVSRKLDERDVYSGLLYFGQKRGRILPVASARFADQLSLSLATKFQTL
ncbi:LysR family transcriptional regulator [Roseibium algae]|uniref:LysR family transcriptional regulator n=1 Tax=Roseibium algae TaxID=3123038 RepID=A0ABU8TF50_9HYPH